MKSKVAYVILAAVVIALIWADLSLRQSRIAASNSNSSSRAAPGKLSPGQVVVQTGQERMSNAVRCMVFMAKLSDEMPEERADTKRNIMAMAGLLFFNDCLMSKMSHGYITITTQEICQSYSNAVVQVFTNRVPPELVDELKHPDFWYRRSGGEPLDTMDYREKRMRANSTLAMFNTFYHSFGERNDIRQTMDDQYKELDQVPGTKESLDTLKSAFDRIGITDAEQSDLKELCLLIGGDRATLNRIYGPKSRNAMREEFKATSESYDKILKWRLTNIHDLDDSRAQALIKAISDLPEDNLSRAGLMPPAHIQ